MRVLTISGSLRRGSYNRLLLDEALRLAPAHWSVERYDDLALLPAFDEDLEDVPPVAAIRRLRAVIGGADGLLIATPEYNASIPGALKNAIDWASRPVAEAALRGKPAAVIGTSTGAFGAVWAQAELRKVLRTAGARVLDGEAPLANARELFDEAGRLREPAARQTLRELIGQFDRMLAEQPHAQSPLSRAA